MVTWLLKFWSGAIAVGVIGWGLLWFGSRP
jgi:hypothetical protein